MEASQEDLRCQNRVCFEDGKFSRISHFNRIWRIISGQRFYNCEVTYLTYKLAQHYIANKELHNKDEIKKTINRKIGEISENATNDPLWDSKKRIPADKFIVFHYAVRSLDSSFSNKDEQNYKETLNQLAICNAQNDACRVFKIFHKGHDLLGFSNNKFYRVGFLERIWRRVTFQGFADCESIHVVSKIIDHYKQGELDSHCYLDIEKVIRKIFHGIKKENKKTHIKSLVDFSFKNINLH